MADIDKKWYVVRAVSGKEMKVKELIESEVAAFNLVNQVSQVLIPKEKVYQIRNGKKISKERSFFPGYILVEANIEGEVLHVIKSITGVIGFLGEERGGQPVPLRPAEVKRILGTVDELSDSSEEITIPFFVGETVKVIDGPFNTFTGIIEEVDNEKKKLTVTVKIFNRKTPVELSFLQVEKEN
jgi:transcriptional antiterminator NusG